jgi:hypothetical protein
MTEPTPPTPPPRNTVSELDLIVAAVVDLFREQITSAVDEVFAGLSAAFPGLYDDPDADTSRRVEYRVLEPGVGRYRNVPPAAAVQAHREGIEVQSRHVTETEWTVEPNPNRVKARSQPMPAPRGMVPLVGQVPADAVTGTLRADGTGGQYVERFVGCEEPPEGVAYRILEDSWDERGGFPPVRTITRYELATTEAASS